MPETVWKEWVLDISALPIVAFCPCDGETVVFGMSVIAERSPGLLVGVVSQHGTKHLFVLEEIFCDYIGRSQVLDERLES